MKLALVLLGAAAAVNANREDEKLRRETREFNSEQEAKVTFLLSKT